MMRLDLTFKHKGSKTAIGFWGTDIHECIAKARDELDKAAHWLFADLKRITVDIRMGDPYEPEKVDDITFNHLYEREIKPRLLAKYDQKYGVYDDSPLLLKIA